MKLANGSMKYGGRRVTPRAGVWIETMKIRLGIGRMGVTPRAGVWIETGDPDGRSEGGHASPPVRGCGLKHILNQYAPSPTEVTPRAGVWIETTAP